jgi:hypothetical protein
MTHMSEPCPTRGERNNNPGNLNYTAPPHAWRGQVGLELVPEGEHFTPRFGRYDCAENGLRALASQLLVYQRRHNCSTPRQIVDRWAPPAENDTGAYAEDFAQVVCAGVDDPIDLDDLATLAAATRAIVRHENGRCLYDAATIAAACRSALAPALSEELAHEP